MKLAFYPIQRLLSERPDPLAIKRRIANSTIAPMTAMSSVAQK